MSNSKKTIEIIKDIELTIIGKIYAHCCYKHDRIGRPVCYQDLCSIHTKLCQLPSMVKASAKYNEKEKFLSEEFGFEFSPLFMTVEQMEIRGKLLFDEHLTKQDNQHDADSCPTIADDENSKYFNFDKK